MKNCNWRPERNQNYGVARGKQDGRAANVEKNKKGKVNGKIHRISVRRPNDLARRGDKNK